MTNQSPSLSQTLYRILNPKSVTVVGASSREASLGHWILRSLINGGFPGGVYPVNPKGGQILGLKVFQDIESLPEPIDLGIIAIPGQGIPKALELLSRKSLAGAIVTAGGFAEMGSDGKDLQTHIADIGRRSGLRLIGPNTVGIINTRSRLNASFSPNLGGSLPGNIGVISQSGSVCETMFFRCQERGMGVSAMISSGNEADLDLCDYLEYMIEDPDTVVIAIYVEQIRRPQRFIHLVQHRFPKKPIVLFRTGRTEQGIAAVSSHTGAMAGSDVIMTGLFRQLGLVEARSYQGFIDSAIALAGERYPQGRRLAVVTGPGAPGVAACDSAGEEGLIMPPLGSESAKRLESILPSIASWRNPVDLTGSAATNPELISQALLIVLKDTSVDGVIIVFGVLATQEELETIIRIITGQPKPVLVVTVASLSENKDTAAIIKRLGQHKIPCFLSPEQAVYGFKILADIAGTHRKK
ncbi:acetate--CoA ligase family protein [Thermodesulfobacteriota bacterium]